MISIINGTILKGLDLKPSKENILIDDGEIIEISSDVCEGEIIDAEGCIVSPTFLNAHTHIGDSIIKDEGDGLSFSEIVKPPNGIKHKALENSDDEDIINAMKESMQLMLDSGTTHFIDYREGGVKGVKLLREAAKDIPISPIILGRDDSFYGENPDLHKVKVAVRKLLKYADGIAPSGFGEIKPEVAEIIVNECRDKSKISSIHVAESINAQNKTMEKYGSSEIELGVNYDFDQLVHLTNPGNSDVDCVSGSDSVVTFCPRANASLSVGIPPVYDFLNIGKKPLIGSDNLMINSPNILRDLEFTLKILRARFKNYVPPEEILKFATTNICHKSNKQILNKLIQKTPIQENKKAQIMITKKLSKNNYLSIINRTETKNIKYILNENFNIPQQKIIGET